MSRHARESLPPAQYLSSSYYEIWLAALEKLMLERGLVSAEEIARATARLRPSAGCRVLEPTTWPQPWPAAHQRTARRPPKPASPPAIASGALNINPLGHTRLPRYARGRVGR